MNVRFWSRAEPLKSALLWTAALIMLSEAFLLLGGKWVLIDQSEGKGDDTQFFELVTVPATRSWRVLSCTYWTGRSTQTVEFSEEYGSAPRECPFVSDAQ